MICWLRRNDFRQRLAMKERVEIRFSTHFIRVFIVFRPEICSVCLSCAQGTASQIVLNIAEVTERARGDAKYALRNSSHKLRNRKKAWTFCRSYSGPQP
jgi:hypothetical protein